MDTKYTKIIDYEIHLKKGILDEIIKFKGLKNDSELAKDVGLSKQYISKLKHRKRPASHDVIIAFAKYLNNANKNWHSIFEIVRVKKTYLNNEKISDNWNKFEGIMPYAKYSDCADIRRPENGGETKK